MIDKVLKNQFINTVDDTYIQELNNKYTMFLGVLFRDLLEHLIDQYRNITTADLEMKNLLRNNLVIPSFNFNS